MYIQKNNIVNSRYKSVYETPLRIAIKYDKIKSCLSCIYLVDYAMPVHVGTSQLHLYG